MYTPNNMITVESLINEKHSIFYATMKPNQSAIIPIGKLNKFVNCILLNSFYHIGLPNNDIIEIAAFTNYHYNLLLINQSLSLSATFLLVIV